jgi:hypothetical protein
MKKVILSAALATGLALTGFAQGVVVFDNSNNTSTDSAATSNGLFWIQTGGVATLLNQDVNAVLYGGATSTSLTPLVTLLLSNHTADGDLLLGGGIFISGSCIRPVTDIRKRSRVALSSLTRLPTASR